MSQGPTGSVWTSSVALSKDENVWRESLGFWFCRWSLPSLFLLVCVACSWLLLAGWAWGCWRRSGSSPLGVFLPPSCCPLVSTATA